MRAPLLLVVCSLAVAGCSTLRDPSVPDVNQTSIPEYLATQERLRADLEDGVIGNLRGYEKQQILDSQRILFARLDSVARIDDLSEPDRIAVLNAQETINGILTGNAIDTPICRRETLTGSHRPQLVCLTQRQRDEQAEAARNALREIQRAYMPVGGASGPGRPGGG